MLIACVYKTGGDYTAEYVERLAKGVARHAPGVSFLCLTDADPASLSCNSVPLRHNWPGWWSKMELFRLRGPVLYFDLDTVICGDLSPLIKQAKAAPFTMLSDFYRPTLGQSGVMAWSGDQPDLYDEFSQSANKHMRAYSCAGMWGDGGFIYARRSQAERWQDVLPGMVTSRKVAATRNDNERVVCYHGKPRPHETGWRI